MRWLGLTEQKRNGCEVRCSFTAHWELLASPPRWKGRQADQENPLKHAGVCVYVYIYIYTNIELTMDMKSPAGLKGWNCPGYRLAMRLARQCCSLLIIYFLGDLVPMQSWVCWPRQDPVSFKRHWRFKKLEPQLKQLIQEPFSIGNIETMLA